MLSLSPAIRIFVHALPTDMRKHFDGLVGDRHPFVRQGRSPRRLFRVFESRPAIAARSFSGIATG